jgi:hypothetical protein
LRTHSGKSVAFDRSDHSYLVDAARGDATTQEKTDMSSTFPIHRRLLTAATLAAGLALGLAANAGAQPASDDFWECAASHDDIGVCCVFYGGDYDERTGECWIDDAAQLQEANPGPSVPPKHRVPTRVDRLPVASLG